MTCGGNLQRRNLEISIQRVPSAGALGRSPYDFARWLKSSGLFARAAQASQKNEAYRDRTLVQRGSLAWQQDLLFATLRVLLLPPSVLNCGFPTALICGANEVSERVSRAELVLRALPVIRLPSPTISMNPIGSTSVGVQIVAGR